ncbi:hypothetical protein FQN54_007419 [Arachnomyces sp. PD_36]|nr:hypothetical protein FQN54_007419 [Arachnomyces sp. PD_36]
MASTRQPPPLEIFQDVNPTYNQNPPPTQPKQLQPSPIPLQSIENASANRNFSLNPPHIQNTHRRPSPTKPNNQRPTSAHSGRGTLNYVPISAPAPPMFTTDSPSKKAPGSFEHSLPPMPQHALFTTFSTMPPDPSYQKENYHYGTAGAHDNNFADFPDPYAPKKSLKRSLMESAPLKDRAAKKQKLDEPIGALPGPQEMPLVEDDGTKPPYSYATLIGMSILRAPNRRLTLAQIYKWISDTFSFYRAGDSGWQNSIRHNLSLNKAFIKQERPKDDPGKGNYWAIEPGMEMQFLKDKPVRRATMSTIALPTPVMPAAPPQPHTHMQPRVEPVPAPIPTPVPTAATTEATAAAPTSSATWDGAPSRRVSISQPADEPDLSSDATIPASDPALQEDCDEVITRPTQMPQIPRSSPPPAIHSSPPIPPRHFTRPGTPPTPSRPVTASAAIPRPPKRKAAAMNDSGYYSSLESSALRPHKASHILTSDLDIEPPRIKRGRAEEEIARIRSSSHDISPSRAVTFKEPSQLMGSSPLRSGYINMLPPPLTPAIKLTRPKQPPPSVSPNTNLRNHRKKIQQMVNSPIKSLGLASDDIPWSPAFNIEEESIIANDNFHVHFDVFADAGNTSTPTYGSPEKRPARRPLGDRLNTPGNVLTEVTGMKTNRLASQFNVYKSKTLRNHDSPSKNPDPERFVNGSQEDFFAFNLFGEDPSDVDGVDLLQGFQKIGGPAKDEKRPSSGVGNRPRLGQKSNTSLF